MMETFKNRKTSISKSNGSAIMVTSMIHPEGKRVWNLRDSIKSISVSLELRAVTLVIATMNSNMMKIYVNGIDITIIIIA